MLTTNVACRYSFIYVFFQFKFSYKKLSVNEGGIAQCCRSRLISCWEQCMEEVEIEYCTGKQYEDGNYSVPGKDVKRYIVKGEYIWKKIVSLTELSTPLDDYWFFFLANFLSDFGGFWKGDELIWSGYILCWRPYCYN